MWFMCEDQRPAHLSSCAYGTNTEGAEPLSCAPYIQCGPNAPRVWYRLIKMDGLVNLTAHMVLSVYTLCICGQYMVLLSEYLNQAASGTLMLQYVIPHSLPTPYEKEFLLAIIRVIDCTLHARRSTFLISPSLSSPLFTIYIFCLLYLSLFISI